MKLIVNNQILEMLTENKVTLFHASPYNFDTFKNRVSYFSINKEFAKDYADRKLSALEYDDDTIYIYKCVFKTGLNIFDANNKTDYSTLYKNLVKSLMGGLDMDRDEFMDELRGVGIIDTSNEYNAAKKFETIIISADRIIILAKDSERAIGIHDYLFNDYLQSALKGAGRFSSLKSFTLIRQEVKELLQSKEIGKNSLEYANENPYGYTKQNFPNDLKRINDRYFGAALEELAGAILTDDSISKKTFKKNPYKINTTDTWRLYEHTGVSNLIEKLGYDGYVAKERGVPTYAIFKPSEAIENFEKSLG